MIYFKPHAFKKNKSYQKTSNDNTEKLTKIMKELIIKERKSDAPVRGGSIWSDQFKAKPAKTFKL